MTGPAVLNYGRHSIDDDDIEAVVRVLRSDWLTQGPAVPEFEDALCQALGAQAAVAVNSGTAALHLGMQALGIGPGDLVLVPAMTFVASANAALYCGAEVAIVDVEADTGLVSTAHVESFLCGYRGVARPRALVAVHYAGLPCDMAALLDLCRRYDLELIEDACHAPGAEWTLRDGGVRRVGDGRESAFSAFSFHPVKHVTTAEGGAVLTNRRELADRVRMLRTHGITRDATRLESNEGPWWYEQHELGFNYRLPDVLAALGTSQLRKLRPGVERRRQLALLYGELLSTISGVVPQATRPGRTHAYHLFPVLVDDRKQRFDALASQGIRAQVHYIPVHMQPYYVRRYGKQHLPGAEAWYGREISLPMFPAMIDADVERVCAALSAVPV